MVPNLFPAGHICTGRRFIWLYLLVSTATLPGCMTTRIMTEPDCSAPDKVTYTTMPSTAYLWGFIQPKDIKPPCDSRFNHLNGVTVKSTFGYYLLSTITLGIVNKRRVTWCCAPYVPPTGSI